MLIVTRTEKGELEIQSAVLLGLKGIKLSSCSTPMSMKFILHINVTVVGMLTFIRRINAIFECFKEINFVIFQYFTFYGQLKFNAQLS